MSELDDLKAQALSIVGKGRKKPKEKHVPIEELPPETLESTDILVVLHKTEHELLLDLLYDGIQADHSKDKKRIMLDLIKHLES